MKKTYYVNLEDVTEVEKKIMIFVGKWVHEQKTIVPLREIVLGMVKEGVKDQTTIKAVHQLVKKQYIRRAIKTSNKTSFVQLRTL